MGKTALLRHARDSVASAAAVAAAKAESRRQARAEGFGTSHQSDAPSQQSQQQQSQQQQSQQQQQQQRWERRSGTSSAANSAAPSPLRATAVAGGGGGDAGNSSSSGGAHRNNSTTSSSLSSASAGTGGSSSGAKPPPLITARCASIDQLRPLLVLSLIVRQIIELWLEPSPDGSYSAEDLGMILGTDTANLTPLLRQLGLSLNGLGGSLLPFKHLPPSESNRLLLEACGGLVAAAVRAYGGLCILIDDLHFCDYGSLDALLEILDGKNFPPPAISLVLATRPSQYYPAHVRGMFCTVFADCTYQCRLRSLRHHCELLAC
jgi:hypothetical protein